MLDEHLYQMLAHGVKQYTFKSHKALSSWSLLRRIPTSRWKSEDTILEYVCARSIQCNVSLQSELKEEVSAALPGQRSSVLPVLLFF